MRKTVISIFLLTLLLSATFCFSAFADTVALPASLSELGEASFQNDTSLDVVVISEGVAEIKPLCFAGSSLREIHLPSSITFIAENAFDSNSGVEFYVLNSYSYGWARDHGFSVRMDYSPIQPGDIMPVLADSECAYRFDVQSDGFYVIQCDSGFESVSAVRADGVSYGEGGPGEDVVFYALGGTEVWIYGLTGSGAGNISLWTTFFNDEEHSLPLNQNYYLNAGNIMSFTPDSAGTYYIFYDEAGNVGSFQTLNTQTGEWIDSESPRFSVNLNAYETLYLRANYNPQSGTKLVMVSNEMYNSVEISNISVTNKGATFTMRVNTRQATADTGYRLGIQFALNESEVGTQAYGAAPRNVPEIRHEVLNDREVQISIDFAPGYQGWVRARMIDPQSGRTLALGQTQALSIGDSLSDYNQLTIDGTVSWSDAGKKDFYFEAPEAGNYILRGKNMTEIRTMDKDCITRGANGDVSNYNFGMNLEQGEVLYIYATNGNSQTCEITMKREQMLRIDTLPINGKDYTAPYYGTQDFSDPTLSYVRAEYWKLKNAYDDFKDYPRVGNSAIPDADYPMYVEPGQVYYVILTDSQGNTSTRVMRCDNGDMYNGMRMTRELDLNGPTQTQFTIEGQTYTAYYYGTQNISNSNQFSSRKFYRLESSAYDNLRSFPYSGNYAPANNYPMPIEAGQAFVIDYVLKDGGGTSRDVMRCDGNYTSDGRLNTQEIKVDAPLYVEEDPIQLSNGKSYTATCYGWQYIGSWHYDAVASEFWRLEEAYDDCRDYPLSGNYSPEANYPMPVKNGEVYMIRYLKADGTEYTQYMRCDGEYFNPDELNTVEFWPQ